MSLLAVSVFFWGTQYWMIEKASPHAPALILAALRIVPAGLLLLACMPLLGARFPRGRVAVVAALSGLIMVTLLYDGFTAGVQLAGAANASVLVNSSPFFIVVLERALSGTKITAVGLIGLAVGFGGIVLMVADQLTASTGAGELLVGILLSLLAANGWAVGTMLVKFVVDRYPETDLVGFTVLQFLVGGFFLAAIGFGAKPVTSVDWGSGQLWWTTAYLAAGSTALATIGYFSALRRLSATRTSTVVFLIPVVAVIVELLRGNSPSGLTLLGIFFAIGGVAIVNTSLAPSAAAGGGVATSTPPNRVLT